MSSRTSPTTRPPRCILIEHHWAVALRDAIARAGGFRLSDGFISPLDLVEIGLVEAEEAEELHAIETAGAARSRRRPTTTTNGRIPMMGSRRVARRTSRRVSRRR